MTNVAARAPSSTAAAQLGDELRAARAKLGWELPQIAAALRIRQGYLEALETGRVAELPGSTYALGFVRTYAGALGLSGDDMVRRFRAEVMESQAQPALRFPAPVPERGVPAGALMLLGLVILAGAYGGWYYMSGRQATRVETVPPIPDAMAPRATVPAPSPQVASILPSTAPPSPRPVAPPGPGAAPTAPSPQPAPFAGAQPPGPAAATPGTGAGAPGAPGTTPVPAQPAPGQPPATTPPSTAIPQATGAAPATAAPGSAANPAPPPNARIVIKATADAWLTIKQKSGPAVLNKLMHAGDAFPVPADKDGLTLTTGNAGGTEIDVDGAPIPASLGGSGAVRRDLPLDADMLKSGKLPPAPSRARPKPPPVPAPADQQD